MSLVETIPTQTISISIGEPKILPQHKHKLWFAEKAFLCAMELGYMTNFTMTVQYKKKYSRAMFSQAMRSFILKNPVFAYGFFREDTFDVKYTGYASIDEKHNGENIIKRPFERITFDDVFEYRTLRKALDIEDLYQLNSVAFPINGKPTYRCVVHEFGNTQYLSFISEHALRDGNSAKFFHEDFIEELQQHRTGAYIEKLFVYDQDKLMLGLPQPPWDKINLVLLKPYTLSLVLLKFLLAFANEWSNPYPKFHVKPITAGYNCKFRHFNIPAKKLNKILHIVRAKEVTLTPYISVLGHQTFQETVISEFEGEFTSNLRISIDARRYFPDELDQLRYSVCVGSHGSTFPPLTRSSVNLLSKVKDVQLQLQKTLETPLFYAERSLLKLVNIWSYFSGVEGTIGHLENFCVSNIGVLSENAIVDLWFSQDCNAFSNVIVSVVSSPIGGLNVVVSYHDYLDVVTNGESSMDKFMRLFESRLLEGV